jgi:hypothetical protein
MSQFQLWAQPWWVNLLIRIPVAAVFSFQRTGRLLSTRQLVLITVFATAFGFVEASVVGVPAGCGGFASRLHRKLGRRSAIPGDLSASQIHLTIAPRDW